MAKRVVIDGATYEFAEDGNLKRVEGLFFPLTLIIMSDPLRTVSRCAVSQTEEEEVGQSGRVSNVCRTSTASLYSDPACNPNPPFLSWDARIRKVSEASKLTLACCVLLLLLRNRTLGPAPV